MKLVELVFESLKNYFEIAQTNFATGDLVEPVILGKVASTANITKRIVKEVINSSC